MFDVQKAPVLRLSSVEQRVEAETNELSEEKSSAKESDKFDVLRNLEAYEARPRRVKYFAGAKQEKLER